MNRSFTLGVFLVALGLGTSGHASASVIDYRAVIVAEDSNGNSLGYLITDPNYWTPQLTSDVTQALIVDFTLNGPTGTQINLTTENGEAGYPYLGAVEGRSNTSADIGSGSLNYLYFGNTDGTDPGATPQQGNYYSANSGITHPGESAIWTIDINGLTIDPVWVNTDGSTPTTEVFIQSTHVYGGGDSAAFHTAFPAPVTDATLHLQILSSVVEPGTDAPEPASMGTLALGVLSLGALEFRRRQKQR